MVDIDYLKKALEIEERAFHDAKAAFEHHKDGDNKFLSSSLKEIRDDEEEHVFLIKQMIEKKRSSTDYVKSDTNFVKYLKQRFSEESAQKVLEVFDLIGLPAPEEGTQYLKGNEGCIILVNKYSVVIRVEAKTPEKNYYSRENDSGCILQPLVSIEAGEAIMEICPGCHVEKNEATIEELKVLLKDEGLVFSDDQLENIGRLNTDNPEFPDGIPLIIDRLAVSKMTGNVKIVKNEIIEKAKKEQERFSEPFREALKDGLEDGAKMIQFRELLERYAAEGKFTAGWNDNSEHFDKIGFSSKTSRAKETSESYSGLFKKFEKKKAKLRTKIGKQMVQANN